MSNSNSFQVGIGSRALLVARLGVALAAVAVCAGRLAAEDNIRVDVVVNTTDEGDKIPPPTPDKPAYYYPWTAGYIELGDILRFQKPPPPTWEIQHQLAKALARKGYLLAKKNHPPSIVLVLWWGYIAPIMDHPAGDTGTGSAFDERADGIYMPGLGLAAGAEHGNGHPGVAQYVTKNESAAEYAGSGFSLPSGYLMITPNDHQMFTFVAGECFQEDQGRVAHDTDEIHEAAHHARYFLMVSALDFQAAIRKKPVLLWCARVSTELVGRDLSDVMGALIEQGVPRFGEETGGPKFVMTDSVPLGHVEVGQPVLKSTYPAGK